MNQGDFNATYGKINSQGTLAASQEGLISDDRAYVTTINPQAFQQNSTVTDPVKRRKSIATVATHAEAAGHNFNTKKEKEKYYRDKINHNRHNNTGSPSITALMVSLFLHSLFRKTNHWFA